MNAYEIQEAAYAAFDTWLASLPDEHDVHAMSLVDQMDAYAKQ